MMQNQLTQINNSLENELLNLFHKSKLPLHFNHTGYKDFTNYQRISLILLFKRSKKAIRTFLNELKESKWVSWLGLPRIPKRSTFHDWLKLFENKLIRKFVELVTDTSKLKVTAIDGTGIKTNFRSPYYEKRLKEFKLNPKSSYHKLDIIVDTENKKQILLYSFRLKNRNDSFIGKKLMKKVKFKRCKIVADKGYPDYVFMDMAKKLENNFISPPKEYKGKCKHNNFKRERKKANYESNKKHHNRRPIVENVIYVLKRVLDVRLRSRLAYMKKREMSWFILLYNINRNVVFEENINGSMNLELTAFFVLIRIFY